MSAKVFIAPEPYDIPVKNPVIFLAGSIDMDKAVDWQTEVTNWLSPYNCTILNPRRKKFDVDYVQSITNPVFKEQVTWELRGLSDADIIAMYLAPNTKSPISLLELGLNAKSDKLIICCPEGFWRKGNVEIIAEKYRIPLYDDYNKWIERLISEVK
jgi:hypothetical protein